MQSGGFVQHGNWPDRTIEAPQQFLKGIDESGIGHVQPFSGLPHKKAGPVSDLDSSFQRAFSKVAGYLSGLVPAP
jgi:hypothetical protein